MSAVITEHEARYYTVEAPEVIHCRLCPQNCHISDGAAGLCRVRRHRAGKLYATNYGRCSAVALDPVEKKPLYHFYPGSPILSLGTVGCNLACQFCQNWQISQADGATDYLSPEQAAAAARYLGIKSGCIGLAFTYSEPFIWYEYVRNTAAITRQAGLKNVLVTNGYVQAEPLQDLLPYIDAMNIDLKAFTTEFYRRICSGRLEPVLETIKAVYGRCHLELTTLVIPTLNDSPEEIERLTDWVASVGTNIPLHFSRYFPNYRLQLEPTPLDTLERAREIAKKKLKYVYIGNAAGTDASHTYCPDCGQILVSRDGSGVTLSGVKGGRCRSCGAEAAIRL